MAAKKEKIVNVKSSENVQKLNIDFPDAKSEEWQTIFIFPMVVPARLFQRSKLYVTFLTAATFPATLYAYYTGKYFKYPMGVSIF